ncbi:MAG: PIN domain-containing protein [Phyllobacteriaceae bacterium]|nr:PIN domain-containing protein [Phyllobacteriaceae bacterium]
MTLFVDTSVWSLALRRDVPPDVPEVAAVMQALASESAIVSTGLVLQELLQGFSGPKQAEALIERFRSLPFVSPDRADHIAAAQLRNTCRKRGVQVGTIDALLAQLCIRHELTLLSTDRDFRDIARVEPRLQLWGHGA